MTTHVSRERREAVKAAIVYYHPHPIKNPLIFQEDIDAWHDARAEDIIAAALPDRAAFAGLLDQVIEWTVEIGGDIHDRTAVTMRDEAVRQLFALVYGDDTQEGAEQ